MKSSNVGAALAATLFASTAAMSLNAAPITGEELAGSSSFDAPSTNELNFTQEVPGREGQIAPYVLLNESAPGTVTLDFFNETNSLAFFEFRIDGQQAGETDHPVVTGDTIHSAIGLDNRSDADPQVSFLTQSFEAESLVEIRLALGGERDWDFDWTSFSVGEAAVPAPGALGLLGLGLVGLAVARRQPKKS